MRDDPENPRINLNAGAHVVCTIEEKSSRKVMVSSVCNTAEVVEGNMPIFVMNALQPFKVIFSVDVNMPAVERFALVVGAALDLRI